MEYLYVNFEKDVEIMTGGGVYTGTKLFLFNDVDFPDAAATKSLSVRTPEPVTYPLSCVLVPVGHHFSSCNQLKCR